MSRENIVGHPSSTLELLTHLPPHPLLPRGSGSLNHPLRVRASSSERWHSQKSQTVSTCERVQRAQRGFGHGFT